MTDGKTAFAALALWFWGNFGAGLYGAAAVVFADAAAVCGATNAAGVGVAAELHSERRKSIQLFAAEDPFALVAAYLAEQSFIDMA